MEIIGLNMNGLAVGLITFLLGIIAFFSKKQIEILQETAKKVGHQEIQGELVKARVDGCEKRLDEHGHRLDEHERRLDNFKL